MKHSVQKINLRNSFFILVFSFFGVLSCTESTQEERNYESDRGKRAEAQNGLVSSAHPLASEAGLMMLKNGGNAVDAAVATAFTLNVVEPNMSGIGGGGSMLIWNQSEGSAGYVDFYPAKRVDTYRDINHDELDNGFNLLSTGIPGTVAGLLEALEKHGTLTRQEVMEPAIRHAREGFPVYLTLAQFIHQNEEKLTRFEGAKNLFWPDGNPLSVGEKLIQPELAATLQKISDEGATAFYEGEIAENMVSILNEGGNPVSTKDFSDYSPQWDKIPLCGTYNGYTVLSAPMPQTGFFIIQALNILEHYNLKTLGVPTVSAQSFDILASALRLSIADRIEYVTDPNWATIPVSGLISKEYANERNRFVGTGSAREEVEPGDPLPFADAVAEPACSNLLQNGIAGSSVNGFESTLTAQTPVDDYRKNTDAMYDEAENSGETTHISVVDADGNAVALSTTLSPVFGSGALTDGFILNTSGYNFVHMDDRELTGSHPYRVRSSTISPTIILKEDEVKLVIGAPGGGRIPTAILQNIVYILDYGLDPLDAIKMPRIFPSRNDAAVQLERGFKGDVLHEVRNMGYDLQTLSQGYARLYLVYRKNGTLIGVADPRHDGEVRGY